MLYRLNRKRKSVCHVNVTCSPFSGSAARPPVHCRVCIVLISYAKEFRMINQCSDGFAPDCTWHTISLNKIQCLNSTFGYKNSYIYSKTLIHLTNCFKEGRLFVITKKTIIVTKFTNWHNKNYRYEQQSNPGRSCYSGNTYLKITESWMTLVMSLRVTIRVTLRVIWY